MTHKLLLPAAIAIAMTIALAAALVQSSSSRAQDTPEQIKAAMAQADQEEQAALDARIRELLTQTGDLEPLVTQYTALRGPVESMVQGQNPGAVSKLAPALETLLAPENVRERVVRSFGKTFVLGGLEEAEEWSRKPSTRSVNKALREYKPGSASDAKAELSASRQALLKRFADATLMADRFKTAMSGMNRLGAELMDAIDPLASTVHDLESGNPAPQGPTQGEIIESWLGPALAPISDADIGGYIAYAETASGNRYFAAVLVAGGMRFGPLHDELLSTVKTMARLPGPADGADQADELIAKAKHLLYEAGTYVVVSEAKALLLRAEKLRPDDAEVQTMLGEIAANMRPGPGHSRQELRGDEVASSFEEMERYLKRAIELDPKQAHAYSLLGRAKFLQKKDDEAAKLFAQAKSIDPDQAWLRVNIADLASAQGRYEEALTLYREALARPQLQSGVHHAALIRSRIAFNGVGRLEEYTALGRKYIEDHPEDVDYPFSYAEHLLGESAMYSESLAILEASSANRNPPLRNHLLAKTYAGLALRSFEKKNVLTAPTRELIAKALEYSDGSESKLVESLAMQPVMLDALPVVVLASEKPAQTASQALGPALTSGDHALIRKLAKSGADLNGPVGPFNEPPLAWAAMTRDVPLFTLFLELGADPERARIDGKPLREFFEESKADPAIKTIFELLDKHEK